MQVNRTYLSLYESDSSRRLPETERANGRMLTRQIVHGGNLDGEISSSLYVRQVYMVNVLLTTDFNETLYGRVSEIHNVKRLRS